MSPLAFRRGVAVAALLLVALPFLVTPFPPAVDLPQHVAQIRLLGEALGGGAETYRVSWTSPNTLVYALLAALWAILPPLAVGRAALLAIALAWVGATIWLAGRRDRSPAGAALAATLVFGAALYWGFLNFLVGWPVFVAWLALNADPAPRARPGRHLAALAAVALLLYGAHVLWLAMGIVVAVLLAAATRPARRLLALRAAALAPAALAAALWYPQLRAARAWADVGAHWTRPIPSRLAPAGLVEAAFGGLRGPIEGVVLGAILLWITLALVTRRGELRAAIDRPLLVAAAPLALLALLGPDKYMNTIYFSQRWLPGALALALIALPAPRLRPAVQVMGSVGLLAILAATTSAAWHAFARDELTGLAAAIEAAPPGGRTLGLDFVKRSEIVRGRPFLQTAAYVQAAKGGTLGFSFAEHGSSVVSFRRPLRHTWTPGLEWYAERFHPRDLGAFDAVLVNGPPALHDRFRAFAGVEPVTASGRFRLYRVARR